MPGPLSQRLRTVASWVALAVGGVLLGASGAVVQASWIEVRGHVLQWGLVLTLVVLVVAVRGAVWWRCSRAAGALVWAAWTATTFVLAQTGPGGDVLLPDGWPSRIYLFGGLALGGAAALVPLPREQPGPAVPPAGGGERATAPVDADR